MRIFCRVVRAALLTLTLSLSPIFVSPSLAVVTSAGDILVADPGSGTIHHYSATGDVLDPFASGLGSPSWITVDRDGNIYVSEFKVSEFVGRITKFSPAGENLLTFATCLTITTCYQPGGVRVGTDGMIYVADYFGGKVYRYSAAGTDPVEFASSLAQADFMAFDAGGNLYVTDSILRAVRRILSTGEDRGDFVTGFPGLAGIAFDAQGNLYVASFNSGFIEKYPASGADPVTFASLDLSAEMLGIAFDASGNLYVANFAQSNIHKFSPAGEDLGVFASTGLVTPRDLVIMPKGAAPTAPTIKAECKEDGWQSFDVFKNQGDCIQLLNTGK
jgi:sugar lactone lactonase YvrE